MLTAAHVVAGAARVQVRDPGKVLHEPGRRPVLGGLARDVGEGGGRIVEDGSHAFPNERFEFGQSLRRNGRLTVKVTGPVTSGSTT